MKEELTQYTIIGVKDWFMYLMIGLSIFISGCNLIIIYYKSKLIKLEEERDNYEYEVVEIPEGEALDLGKKQGTK